MIYLSGEGLKIIVLESANLDEIRKGKPAKTPDGSVLIAWTPDPVWLADKILESDGDAKKIADAIDESAKRPQKPSNRPKHETHIKTFLGED